MTKKLNWQEAMDKADKRIRAYLDSPFFKEVSTTPKKSFNNARVIQLADIEAILDKLEETEYFSRSSYGARNNLQRGYNYDVTLMGDNGDKTRTFKVNLGRIYLGSEMLIHRREIKDFSGPSYPSDVDQSRGLPFFKELELTWELLMKRELDFLHVVGRPKERKVILHKAIESDEGLLYPDRIDDPSVIGHNYPIIEPVGIRYIYPTNDVKHLKIYFLLSPAHVQADLAEKAISYKKETIDRSARDCNQVPLGIIALLSERR